VSDPGVVNVAETDRKFLDRTDVYVVASAVVEPVVRKLRVFDEDLAVWVGSSENALLAMME